MHCPRNRVHTKLIGRDREVDQLQQGIERQPNLRLGRGVQWPKESAPIFFGMRGGGDAVGSRSSNLKRRALEQVANDRAIGLGAARVKLPSGQPLH